MWAYLAAVSSFYLYAAGVLQLAPDEAYYWYWAKHPDLSYLDHPPMIAYLIAASTMLGGESEFFVRLPGCLCYLGSLFFVFLTFSRLFSAEGRYALEAAAMFNLTVIFPIFAVIITPDTPMLFFWSGAMYFGSRLVTCADGRWWYLWGLALGLGLLSKYTMILIVPCVWGFLLFSSRHRFWLFRKEPYAGLAVAFLVFLPVLVWNYRHGWVSFNFQLHQGFTPDSNSVLMKAAEYWGGQAAVITPLIFLAFAWYSLRATGVHVREGRPSYLYLLFLAWPVILFFGITTVVGDTAEANWPAPAYLAGLPLMWAVYRANCMEEKRHTLLVWSGVAFGLLLNCLISVHVLAPFVPVSPGDDPARQLHSWRGLGRTIEEYIERHPCDRGYFLVSDRGTTLAETVYYTGNRYTGIDFLIPERYIFLDDLAGLKGRNAILVVHGRDRQSLEIYKKYYSKYFERVSEAGRWTHSYRGAEIPELSVALLLGEGYKGNWNRNQGCRGES